MKYIEPPQFVLCVDNRQNPASLETRRVYRVVQPDANDPPDYVRIVDESGEDYLFPKQWFVLVELPQEAVDALNAQGQAA